MAIAEDAMKDWKIARTGISLLLNNKTEEAEALFTEHPHSFHVKAGRCFVLFMNALMTFEEDKFQQATLLLKDMERECAGDIGWLKSVKSKVFRGEETDKDYVNKLERQIVLADTQVFSAVSLFLQQELTGYVRGCWMLRKAWRVYQHAYTQISQLYRRTFGTNPTGFNPCCINPTSNGSSMQSPQSPEPSEWSIPSCNGYANNVTPVSSPSGLRSSLSMLFSLTGITSEQQTPFVEPTEVTRLMSAASFGYGIYQLCVSLLPPSVLKVIHFFGFEGNRQSGLTALMYARLGEDMRAPLATLALLWYHTIVRPFFALDGSNVKAGVVAAKQLIAECHAEFQNSALFLFFIGRMERLETNVDGALEAFGKAVDVATQREVKLLCFHEVAWCHVICLNYDEAYRSLLQLQQQSRWSKGFYAYLAMVCCGANGKFDTLLSLYSKILPWFHETKNESQLDVFIMRRLPKIVDKEIGHPYTILYYKLLVYESLYLWNALPSCPIELLRGILYAMSVSHLCDKYSATGSFKMIKTDLGNLRSHLHTLSLEVKNVIEVRDELKSKLKEMSSVIPKISEAILNLRNEVSEEMSLHTKNLLEALSPETVRNMVKNELQKYDADKTGRTDYALESSGGAILSTRDTETYVTGAPALSLFGIPLCHQQNTPRVMIQTGVLPGECWAFKGSSGSVAIRLLGHVHVSGVSLEHISSLISPTGDTATAPKDFSIWGLTDLDDEKPFLFGNFVYDNTGSPLQYFEVQNRVKEAYKIIELKVHSNSGDPEYTCIYRIRVHGSLSKM
ncbi:hypothetical protein PUN28_017704 [Cardiocondyla obscurior]|uniref:SUN domain-containing protein n=1 Tax=Cardiocondyla obscurior TaxID=286306 RepID=A0AAW2EIP7_9HYME